MGSAPSVTVLMPAKDAMPFIAEAVASILAQDFTDFELIVVDDGSCDGTSAHLASIADSRIKVIRHETPRGVAASLNEGLSAAAGGLVARMDADDVSAKDRLGLQIAAFERDPGLGAMGASVRMFGTRHGAWTISEDGDRLKASLCFGSCFAHPSAMISLPFLDRHSLRYDEGQSLTEDYDLWIRIAERGRLGGISRALLDYRTHAGSVSATRKADQDVAADGCRRAAFERLWGVSIDVDGLQAVRFLGNVDRADAIGDAGMVVAAAGWARSMLRSGPPVALAAELRERLRNAVRRSHPLALVAAGLADPSLATQAPFAALKRAKDSISALRRAKEAAAA